MDLAETACYSANLLPSEPIPAGMAADLNPGSVRIRLIVISHSVLIEIHGKKTGFINTQRCGRCVVARHCYKLLFSHPRLVQDLITGFVQPQWLDSIDFKTLEPVKASFATDDLRQRHDDCIWRMKFKDTWLYLYLLLEFQSSDDYFMANRVMTYLGLLYQDIIRSQVLKKGDLLPPVLPIVIYNGASNWSGPVEIR